MTSSWPKVRRAIGTPHPLPRLRHQHRTPPVKALSDAGWRASSKANQSLSLLKMIDKFEPLGSSKRVWEDKDKDDEERRLEGVLFRKPYVPSSEGRAGVGSEEKTGICPRWVLGRPGTNFLITGCVVRMNTGIEYYNLIQVTVIGGEGPR